MTDQSISIVDFSPFSSTLDESQERKKETAQKILRSFQETGFVYLVNHGVEKGLVDGMFDMVCSSFVSYSWHWMGWNGGYRVRDSLNYRLRRNYWLLIRVGAIIIVDTHPSDKKKSNILMILCFRMIKEGKTVIVDWIWRKEWTAIGKNHSRVDVRIV